jgi:DNA helicase-2/ATP-dependent DNA helicase PcrA
MNINGNVTISTIHKAKGLEWDYVFLLGCNDEYFSEFANEQQTEALEEKRRLFYVAITRAALQLQMYMLINNYRYKMARFLAEIVCDC